MICFSKIVLTAGVRHENGKTEFSNLSRVIQSSVERGENLSETLKKGETRVWRRQYVIESAKFPAAHGTFRRDVKLLKMRLSNAAADQFTLQRDFDLKRHRSCFAASIRLQS